MKKDETNQNQSEVGKEIYINKAIKQLCENLSSSEPFTEQQLESIKLTLLIYGYSIVVDKVVRNEMLNLIEEF